MQLPLCPSSATVEVDFEFLRATDDQTRALRVFENVANAIPPKHTTLGQVITRYEEDRFGSKLVKNGRRPITVVAVAIVERDEPRSPWPRLPTREMRSQLLWIEQGVLALEESNLLREALGRCVECSFVEGPDGLWRIDSMIV